MAGNGRRFGDVWLGLWLWKLLASTRSSTAICQGKETVRPADIVAIEVINRLCGLAASLLWRSTGMSTPVWKTCSACRQRRDQGSALPHAGSLAGRSGVDRAGPEDPTWHLFQLDYDLLLYDLTSTYFEGLAEENDLAQRGYSRDHRKDCKQVILALVVTRDGFPLAHALAGNTQDLQTVETIVTEIEQQFGKTQRIWVMDRGMVSKESWPSSRSPAENMCWQPGVAS